MDGVAVGCSDPGDRPLHSDLGLAGECPLWGLPGAPWAGAEKVSHLRLFQPVSFPLVF